MTAGDLHCPPDPFEDVSQRCEHRPIRGYTLIGLGCATGSAKMAQISTSVGAAELDSAINWRFSLENLLAANDRITGFMAAMELPNIYRRAANELHTASDGQKFEVRADSLNANYSFKYFGKGQGVSAYTFIDERNLFW